MAAQLLPNHLHTPGCSPREGAGWVEAAELEWGRPGWLEGPVRRLAEPGVDLVVAADCCYIDQDGASPSTPAFVQTCAALAGPTTRCLVTFERRAPEASMGGLGMLVVEWGGARTPHSSARTS